MGLENSNIEILYGHKAWSNQERWAIRYLADKLDNYVEPDNIGPYEWSKNKCFAEVYHVNQYIKFIFDIEDASHDCKDVIDVDAERRNVFELMNSWLVEHDYQDAVLKSIDDVIAAKKAVRWCEGWKAWKSSVRLYIPSVVAISTHVGDILRDAGFFERRKQFQDKCNEPLYDDGIYGKKRRCLYCVKTYKYEDPSRTYLLPIKTSLGNVPLISDYVITYITGKEHVLKFEKASVANVANVANTSSQSNGSSRAEVNAISNRTSTISGETLTAFVNHLDPQRASHGYNDWVRYCWAILNIGISNGFIEKARLLAHAFSSKSNKYDCAALEKVLTEGERRYTSRSNPIGFGSLCLWVKADSPAFFNKFTCDKEHLDALINKDDHTGVAKVAAHFLKGKYAYVIKTLWYECNENGIWKVDDAAIGFRWALTSCVSQEIQNYYCSLLKETNNSEKGNDRSKHIQAISFALRNAKYKDDIVRESRRFLQNDKIVDMLDSTRNVLAFTDGLYDWNVHAFRKTKPEDYVQKTVGYSYEDMMNVSDESVEIVRNLVRSMFLKQDVFEFVMKAFDNALDGLNWRESFDIFTGFEGSNGKSTLLSIASAAFGEYYTVLSSDALGKNIELSPQLMKLKGSRLAVISEPDEASPLSNDLIKKLSGNDAISCRTLFKEPITFPCFANILLVCNDIPSLNKVDEGTKRRLKITPFEIKFVSKPDPNNEKQRPKDEALKDYINKNTSTVGMAFMRLLMSSRLAADHEQKRLLVPEDCLVITNDFIQDADPFADWFEANYEITGSENDKISSQTLRSDYCSQNKGYALNVTAFGRHINAYISKGVTKKKCSGAIVYFGLRVRPRGNEDSDVDE